MTLMCVVFALTIFAGRLVQLEGLDSAAYKTASQDQQLTRISIPAVRGNITTSNGTVLAMTVQTYSVFADPKLIPVKLRPTVAAKLAGPLQLTSSAVLNMLNHPSSPEYQVLGTGVSVAAGHQITALELPGIDMTAAYNTAYPNGDLASDIVGFTRPSSAGDGSQSGDRQPRGAVQLPARRAGRQRRSGGRDGLRADPAHRDEADAGSGGQEPAADD